MKKITILRDNETLFSLTENSGNRTTVYEVIEAYNIVEKMGILPSNTNRITYTLKHKNQTEDKNISINKLIDIVIDNFVKNDEVIKGHKVSFYVYMGDIYTIVITK